MKVTSLAIALLLSLVEAHKLEQKSVIVSQNQLRCLPGEEFQHLGQSLVEKKGWKHDLPGEFKGSDVKELNVDAFSSQNFSKGKIVLAYHPQCPHCKKMVPDYKKFAQEAKAKGIEVQAINMSTKVNESKENMAKFCPEGYPTVKYFKTAGEGVEMKEEGDLASLKKFASSQGL